MRTLITALSLALLFGGLGGCGDADEHLQKIGEGLAQTWEGVKGFTVERREEAEAFFEKSLGTLEEGLAEARAKAEAMGEGASEALQSQWADLEAKLDEVQNATGEAWAKSRDAFVKAYEAFQAELGK